MRVAVKLQACAAIDQQVDHNQDSGILEARPRQAIAFEYDLDRTLQFFEDCGNPLVRVPGMVGIGVLLDGKLVVAGVYERFNGVNVWGHVAALPGGAWKSREIMSVPFVYAFDIAKVKRITGYVDVSNRAAIKFSESLGFKHEATLSGAAKDGGDVHIYVMRREDCRYVD